MLVERLAACVLWDNDYELQESLDRMYHRIRRTNKPTFTLTR
jgi:hypothetical protein